MIHQRHVPLPGLIRLAGGFLIAVMLLALAVCGPEASNDTVTFRIVQRIAALDTQDGDDFGYSVDIHGDVAIVGAPHARSEVLDIGAAYIFSRGPFGQGRWRQVKKLTPRSSDQNQFFGGAVAISGDYALVGASWNGGGGTSRGTVTVYSRNLGGWENWGELKVLTASDANDYDHFGNSLDLEEGLAIIGASDKGEAGSSRGAAYLFGRNQGGPDNWGEVRKLVPSDSRIDQRFGFSVTVSERWAVAGAMGDSEMGWAAGAGYIFARDQGGPDNWGELKKIFGSGLQVADEFGTSVAISGENLLAGVPYMTAAGSAGAVCVFSKDRGGTEHWGEAKKANGKRWPRRRQFWLERDDPRSCRPRRSADNTRGGRRVRVPSGFGRCEQLGRSSKDLSTELRTGRWLCSLPII